ncbi:hypothetical protein AK812_SmicGene16924 [Symbiodinium microadriaticum]|uniref:Uncharacterized protein n=1 Tax=Symbiodinium microadriaticum TaxID=2951 RepID=A0A1Q9DZ12_SYMMI|nr:hypothetical protein AK812_SmicGene16924 [Symbiodinium microadriaticum]
MAPKRSLPSGVLRPEKPQGFLVVPDFVSASEEEALLQELRDGKRHWLDKAHLKFSNTRQQEYGPQISDAMEVVEAEPRIPPTKTAALAQKVAELWVAVWIPGRAHQFIIF